MPPSNSPSQTPSSPSDPPYIRQLLELGTTLPDLASSISSQTEDENLHFLRNLANYASYSRESSDRHSTSPRSSWFAGDGTRSMNSDERVLRRSVLSTRQRYMQRLVESRPPREHAYSERAPTYHPNQPQSIYDWAPAMSDEEDTNDAVRLQDAQMRMMLEEQQNRRASRHSLGPTSSSTPGSRYRLFGSTQASDQDSGNSTAESSLRSLALMQSIRRHPRLSGRTNRSSNHPTYMERERSFQDSSTEATPRPPTRFNSGEDSTRLRGLEAAMQRHLTGRSVSGALHQPRWLVEAINYLDGIRLTNSVREARAAATARGFFCSEFCADTDTDILMDVSHLQSIPESSWLRIGSCFEGSQYTHPTGAGRPRTGRNDESSNPERNDRLQNSQPDPSKLLPEDKWRVKVTIHSIDYSTMKLTGTMEAMNVPDRLSESGSTSILTYLEGEIIDFKEHSLKTVNFRSEPDIDAEYWRRLEPFVDKNELNIARNVLSPKWLSEDLREDWILMRWKELCFIKPAADQHRGSLSISGFYYVSMRRSDGFIEGFYFDYAISPFQHLSLRPSQQSFPSYEFR